MKSANIHDYISFELQYLNGEHELVVDQVVNLEHHEEDGLWYRTRKNWLVPQSEIRQVNPSDAV